MCDQKREGVDLMLSKFSINFHKNIVESGLNRLGLFFLTELAWACYFLTELDEPDLIQSPNPK